MSSSNSWRQMAQIAAFYQIDHGGRCGSNPITLSTGAERWAGVESVAPKSGTGATANRPAPDTRKVGS